MYFCRYITVRCFKILKSLLRCGDFLLICLHVFTQIVKKCLHGINICRLYSACKTERRTPYASSQPLPAWAEICYSVNIYTKSPETVILNDFGGLSFIGTQRFSSALLAGGALHSAVRAVAAAGRNAFLFIFSQFDDNSGNDQYQNQRNNDRSDICAQPCEHIIASFLKIRSFSSALSPLCICGRKAYKSYRRSLSASR